MLWEMCHNAEGSKKIFYTLYFFHDGACLILQQDDTDSLDS